MRYTLYCDYGHLGKPGMHYLYIGEWLRPGGKLVLHHGIMTDQEYFYIRTLHYCPVYNIEGSHLIRIYQDGDDRGTTKYRRSGKYQSVGFLRLNSYNLYVGRVTIY